LSLALHVPPLRLRALNLPHLLGAGLSLPPTPPKAGGPRSGRARRITSLAGRAQAEARSHTHLALEAHPTDGPEAGPDDDVAALAGRTVRITAGAGSGQQGAVASAAAAAAGGPGGGGGARRVLLAKRLRQPVDGTSRYAVFGRTVVRVGVSGAAADGWDSVHVALGTCPRSCLEAAVARRFAPRQTSTLN